MAKVWKVYKTAEGRIAVDTGGWDENTEAAIAGFKKLPGARFRRSDKVWHFPLLWEVCTGLRELANRRGTTLRIYPSLAEWARAEKARRDLIPSVNESSRQELPVLEATYPATAKAIYSRPFQTVGAKFIATNRNALIADEPGLGKTLQTISAVVESKTTGPILVVGPKSAVGITWPAEIERWAPGERVVVVGPHFDADGRNEAVRAAVAECPADERVWVCVSPYYVRVNARLDEFGRFSRGADGRKIFDMVQYACAALFEPVWSALIVDESHQTLAVATGNLKRQSAQRVGLGALEVRKDGLRVAMSGTPFRGKHENLWGTLNFLRPEIYTGFWKWCEKHFDVSQDYMGHYQIGYLNDEKALYDETSSLMLRRTKREVAKDLPPKLYGGEPLDGTGPTAVWLPLEDKQAKQYQQMVKHAVADLDGGQIMANGSLPEIMRLRQIACGAGKLVNEEFHFSGDSNKLDWLIEFLDERGIDKAVASSKGKTAGIPKVIVTSQFSKLLEAFRDALWSKAGVMAHLFTGKSTPEQRAYIKDDWQNNGASLYRVVLLNMHSGGTSLTLDAADEVVTLDEPWNRDDEEQVEDRAHRLSNMHQVTVWRLRSLGTIEEGIARNTTAQDRDIKAVLDGSRKEAIREMMLGGKG